MSARALFFAALGHLPAAVALLEELRWPKGVVCPHCGGRRIGGHGRYWRQRAMGRYRCKGCRRTFLVTTGTPLARSRVPLTVWVTVAWLVTQWQSALHCAKETALHYGRVYALMWRLIEAAIGYERDRRLEGTVEGDEIYLSCGHKGQRPPVWPGGTDPSGIGPGRESGPLNLRPVGGADNEAPTDRIGTDGEPNLGPELPRQGRRRGLRHGPGRGHAQKDRPVIFVWVQRSGQMVVRAGAGVDRDTVTAVLTHSVQAHSTLYTDSARCYLVVTEAGYTLEQVNHSQGEYARGEVHENRAEGEIALLRLFFHHRRGVALSNLPAYLTLYQFTRNHRHLTRWEQATLLMAALLGQGPAPCCWVPPAWAHRLEHCTVGRYTSTE